MNKFAEFIFDKKSQSFIRNKTSGKDYIEFQNGNGCYSLAGRNGKKQAIVLFDRCAEEHTLIHEVYYNIESKKV